MTSMAQYNVDPTILELLPSIMEALRSHMSRQSGIELIRMQNCQQELVLWRDVHGCQGELPYAAEMKAWGVNVDGLFGRLEALANWQSQYDQMQAMVEEGIFWYQAVELAERIQADVPRGKMEHAQQILRCATQQLEERTSELERIAEEERDLRKQEKRWGDVLNFNPRSTKAREGIQQTRFEIARETAVRELKEELPLVVRRAYRRAKKLDLPGLAVELTRIQAWKAMGERTPPVWSSNDYDWIEREESKLISWRNKVRDELGKASTLGSSDKRAAYLMVKAHAERGVPVLPDPVTGLEIKIERALDNYRREFVSSLRSLAMQYIDTAEKQLRENVELAFETAERARSLFEDPELLPGDRVALRNDIDLVERKWRSIQQQYDHYRQCGDKVSKAGEPGTSPFERLELLRSAERDYPDYPRLASMLKDADYDVAAILASDIEAAMTRARRCVLGDRFDEAFGILADARTAAVVQMPKIPPESRLAEQLTGLQRYEARISHLENVYLQIGKTTNKVDQLVQRYDDGELAALTQAEELLNQLSAEARQRSEVRRRLATVEERRAHEVVADGQVSR